MIGSELPKGWKEVKLSDLAEIQSGGTPSRSNSAYWNGDIPWVKISDIKGKYVTETEEFITEEGLMNSSAKMFERGTILFSIFATIGKVAILDIDATTNQALVGLKNNELVDKSFLVYALTELSERISNLGKGVAQKNINISILKDVRIPLPPLTEQKQIAEKLDKLFDQIETIKKASNRIPELLKNFRQQVLTYAVTGKLTNSDFAHWEKSTIGAIGKVKGGKRLPKGEELVNYNTGYPYIRARDLKEGTVLKQNIMYLLPETQEKIKNYIVKTNDVYITIVGAKIGDAGIIPESMNNANLTENAAKITDLSEKIMPQYLSLWLQAPLCQSEIQQSIKSAAQGKLALTRINSLSVCFPPIESQKEIIDKVEYLLGELKIIESKFYQLQNILEKLPQALLCKAFKGELL